MTTAVEAAVAAAFRDDWGQVVGTLIAATGDWDLAEECAQEAFTQALEEWPRRGIPTQPGAWLTTTARHRVIDRQRRAATGAVKLREATILRPDDHDPERAAAAAEAGASGVRDERLRLIFTCCHPALAFEARIALTLRTLAGLTTAEIARAFLVPEATMAQRLVRAKRKIRNAGIPYRVPPAHLLAERTAAVLGVVYLLFNEGHLERERLSAEAIRLGRMLVEVLPDEPEAAGLLALMLLHEARRSARVDATGMLVPLDRQDRTVWDAAAIAEGRGILTTALAAWRVGPYQLQAAIVACHAEAATAADTDWPQIAALYERLAEVQPSAVVELNRAVAVGMADGPAAGLRLVDALDAAGTLDGYHLLPATRADLLRRLDRPAEAAEAYREALALTGSEAERRYLQQRLTESKFGE